SHPPSGCTKLNTNQFVVGRFLLVSGVDDDGTVIAVFSQKIDGKLSINDSRPLAIQEGFLFVVRENISVSFIKCDAVKIINDLRFCDSFGASVLIFKGVTSLMVIANCGSYFFILCFTLANYVFFF
ncbi:LOW QUALITY PROTEIN: hypothetical protein PanWU01x14_323270, partial [Parasponia andersonii]